MSAFIVSHDHIDALVTWASLNNVVVVHGSGPADDIKGNEQAVGQCLLYENNRSVAYCYSHRDDIPQADIDRYRYRFFAEPLSAVAILKAVDCYVYQSCEHPEWDHSMAKRIAESIRHSCWRKVPGYEEAAWCITRAEPDREVVPLSALMN